MARLDRSFGRAAFGSDPANYHAARPAYPAAVWSYLAECAGLVPGAEILEIGAGTGLATEPMLETGPQRLLTLEPDDRLVRFLRQRLTHPALEVVSSTFEAAAPAGPFDLCVSATAFHWLDAVPALIRLRALLRPDGAVALIWTMFADPDRPDAFHEATQKLFAETDDSPSAKTADRPEHGRDAEARLADFEAAGFAAEPPRYIADVLRLDGQGVRRLYQSFSNVVALPEARRQRLLDGLVEVAERDFGGVVERNLLTSVYVARPKPQAFVPERETLQGLARGARTTGFRDRSDRRF